MGRPVAAGDRQISDVAGMALMKLTQHSPPPRGPPRASTLNRARTASRPSPLPRHCILTESTIPLRSVFLFNQRTPTPPPLPKSRCEDPSEAGATTTFHNVDRHLRPDVAGHTLSAPANLLPTRYLFAS
ncbi:unnamed protein product [Arctogadus glacialis]